MDALGPAHQKNKRETEHKSIGDNVCIEIGEWKIQENQCASRDGLDL